VLQRKRYASFLPYIYYRWYGYNDDYEPFKGVGGDRVARVENKKKKHRTHTSRPTRMRGFSFLQEIVPWLWPPNS
jgi:hypothetical protein